MNRPIDCRPKPKGPVLPSDPCERLAVLEEALFALASGNKRTEVRDGDKFVRFGFGYGSIAFLEREVARLRAICGKRQAITVGRKTC